MSERKAKSAPAKGRRVKPKDKKVTTIKEINAWVHRGNSDQGNRKTARNTGLLTENVTEERLLFNKQLELGRERYKFLANHAYEKQKFLERQKRKQKRLNSSAMSEKESARKHSLTVRIPQVDELSNSSGEYDVFEDANGRKMSTEEKERVMDELHLPQAVTPRRSKTAYRGIYLDSSRTANSKAGGLAEKLPAVSVKTEIDSVPMTPKTNVYEIPHDSVDGAKPTMVSCQPITPAVVTSVDMKTLASNLQSVENVRRRHKNRRIRYGEKFPSSVDDPRYLALEESLIPLEMESDKLDDVSDIIKKHDILRRESKSFKAFNSKYSHQKFLAFLLQKELSIR